MRKNLILALLLLCLSSLSARPKVALVLAGGGAKGISEIPVIAALEKHGIPIDMVLGTSMGSLLGGIYSAGYSPSELKNLMYSTDMMATLNVISPPSQASLGEPFVHDFSNVFTVGFGAEGIGQSPGILGDQGILEILFALLAKVEGIEDFDHLDTPFRCVATDAVSGKAIVYKDGSLSKAIRSSISIPLVFAPFPQGDGTYAMDGGLVDNIPIDLAKEMGADFVIAVNVSSPHNDPQAMTTISGILFQTLGIVIQNNSAPQFPNADIVLFPDMEKFGILDFNKAKEIYEVGEKMCAEQDQVFADFAEKYVAAGGELVYKDPNRKGSYKSLPSPVVSSVVVDNQSTFSRIPEVSEFQEFIGKEMSVDTVKKLVLKLDNQRIFYRLSSLSATMDGANRLHVIAQGYDKDQDVLSLGGYSSLSATNQSSFSNKFWIVPSFSIAVDVNRLQKKGFTFHFKLGLADTHTLSAGVDTLFANFPHMKVGLLTKATYKWGSLLPITSSYVKILVGREQGLCFDGAFRFDFYDTVMVYAGGRYEMYWLNIGDDSYDPRTLQGSFGFIWDNIRDQSFAWKGGTVEALVLAGKWNDSFIYELLARAEMRFELKHNASMLGFNAIFTSIREPYVLTSSFQDYGGYYGMPGYGNGSWKRDIAIAGVMYQQKLIDIMGLPLLLVLEAKVGTSDGYDVFENYLAVPPDGFFVDCIGLDAGFRASLGLDTPIGEVLMGFGYSIKNRFCFSISII